MKIVKVISICVCLFLFANSELYSDDAQYRLIVSKNDLSSTPPNNEFYLDLQIEITSGTSPRTLNSLTADVYYGSELTAWSGLDPSTNNALGSEYSVTVSKNSGYYRVLVVQNGLGVNSGDNTTPGTGNPPGFDVTSIWKTILTLRWTINTESSVNISIDDASNAAAYFNNYTNAPRAAATSWVVSNQDLGNVPTPVELSSFAASVNQSVVNLKWQTATEVNNYGFEVERKSNDNKSTEWVKISFVEGSGNSNSPKDYSFADKNITGGSKFSYRLKQIDNDGTFTYSGKVDVEVVPTKYELFQNYPNPFNPVTNIKFSLPEDSNVRINIYNILGERVMELINADYKAGYYVVQFNSSSSGLASGMYIYSIETKNFKSVKKMILMK